MTNGQAHIVFKTVMDKNSLSTSFGGSPAFLPEEIDIFLNQGLTEKVFNKFTGNNPLQVAFEGNIKRVEDLQRLVKTDYLVDLTYFQGKATNCYFTSFSIATFPMSRKRMLFVNAVVKDGKGASYTAKYVDSVTFNRFMVTSDNYPYIPNPAVTIENDTLLIAVDPLLLTGDIYVDITYVDTPPVINYLEPLNEIPDIPDSVMMEAINRAVEVALENIESARTSSKLQINTLQE